MEKEVSKLLEKAHDIESTAAYDYTFGLARLISSGAATKEFREAITSIAVDTIIHKHLTRALLEAFKEVEKLGQNLSSLEERQVTVEQLSPQLKTLLKVFIERHLEIEKDMIAVYEEISKKTSHPLLKILAQGLADNEKKHHKYLLDLKSIA